MYVIISITIKQGEINMKKQFTLTAYFKGQDGSMGFKIEKDV